MITKTIASVAFALTSIIGGVSAAEANTTHYCYRNNSNNYVCIHSVNKSTNFYTDRSKYVVSSVNGGRRTGEWVKCPVHIRNNYKANMYGIACYEFN